jgi:hypothetical protein
VRDDVGDGLDHGLRRRRLRRQQFEPVTDQQAGVEIDDPTLDAAASDVDAESAALSPGCGGGG